MYIELKTEKQVSKARAAEVDQQKNMCHDAILAKSAADATAEELEKQLHVQQQTAKELKIELAQEKKNTSCV